MSKIFLFNIIILVLFSQTALSSELNSHGHCLLTDDKSNLIEVQKMHTTDPLVSEGIFLQIERTSSGPLGYTLLAHNHSSNIDNVTMTVRTFHDGKFHRKVISKELYESGEPLTLLLSLPNSHNLYCTAQFLND